MEFVSLAMGIVNLVVVCCNIFVLYIMVSQKSLHTSTNFLVLSLTISDLLLGIVILPFAIIQEQRQMWLFGGVGCRLWLSMDVWLSTASIYNLLAISFDRYMAVKQPIRYPSISSARVTRLLVAGVWTISLILACCLYILDSLHENRSGTEECTPMRLPSLYIVFSASASFFIPAIIMVLLNVSIFKTVLTSSRSKCVSVKEGVAMRVHRGRPVEELQRYQYVKPKKRASETDSLVSPHNEVSDGESPTTLKSFFSHVMVVSMISTKKGNMMTQLGERSSRFSRLSMRTEVRVARTTGIVVAAFVICWFPFSMIYVFQAYDICPLGECVPEEMFTIAFWLGYANSAVNPLLYAAFSRDFRAAFRKFLLRPYKK